MYTYKTQIFLHHTDAAGRLFFARQFELMHEAKEKFFEHIGAGINTLLNDPKITFPLVHAEADYKAALRAGDRVAVTVEVEKLSETSASFLYTITKDNGTLAGTGKTVSVTVSKETGQKVPIPEFWRSKLSAHTK